MLPYPTNNKTTKTKGGNNKQTEKIPHNLHVKSESCLLYGGGPNGGDFPDTHITQG